MVLPEVRSEPRLDFADDLLPSHGPATRNGLSGWRRLALGVAVPGLLVLGWCLADAAGVLSPRLLPPPSAVLHSARDFLFAAKRPNVPGVVPFRGAAVQHIRASVGRWAVAYTIAVVVGLPFGLGLGLSRWAAAALDPLFQALRSVPITAWLPIALVWFGLGEGAARFLVFVGAVSPIVIATADSVARVPRQLVDTARMLGT